MAHFRIDFARDWTAWMHSQLQRLGYTPPPRSASEEISHAFWNAQHRLITAVPRRVHLSRTIPQPLPAATRRIVAALERGYDLTPFQSKQLRRTDQHDWLLNDWGIHHFHLGVGFERTGFVNRTDGLLYAMVASDEAWLVALGDHDDFDANFLLQTVHDNWPHLLERHRVAGLKAPPLSDADRKTLRRRGVMALSQVSDGTVYGPLGGGYASSGISARVVLNSDRAFDYVAGLQHYCEQNLRGIATLYQTHLRSGTEVQLRIDEAGAHAICPDEFVWSLGSVPGLKGIAPEEQESRR